MNSNTASPLPKIATYRKVGNLTFLAGHVGSGPKMDRIESFTDEARLTFENLKSTLADAGGGFEHVVSIRAYLTDFKYFADFNEVWSETFPVNPPTRATVQVGLADPFRIELEAIAEI